MTQSKEKVQIIVDESKTWVEKGKNLPSDWASRVLYLGEKGAQNWLNVVNEANYPLRGIDPFDLHKNRIAAIQGMAPATIVSFGPGDGLDDIEIVAALKSSNGKIQYIPIDISSRLLKLTISNLSPHVEIPMGILGDFEGGQDFLFQALSQHARTPILFSFLGTTIGNLDGDESKFLAGFKKILGNEDFLLIDVPLAGPGWNAKDEPRLNMTTYSDGFKRFLGGAVLRWDSATSEQDLMREFEKRIAVSWENKDKIGARTITIFDKYNDKMILKFRRYEWHSFLRLLQEMGFNIRFSKCSISSNQDKLGIGVILLTAK